MGDYPRDVVSRADEDYSREAAAYEYLEETGHTGSFAPTYHGLWTFDLPTISRNKTQTRPVRLILIGYLGGACIPGCCIPNDPYWDGEDAYHHLEEYSLRFLRWLWIAS